MNFSLICTSITSLKPFLKAFHSGAVVATVGGASRSGLYSGSNSLMRPQQGIYMMTSFAGDAKEAEPMTDSSGTGSSSLGPPPRGNNTTSKIYRSNDGEVTTVISSQRNEDGGESVDSTKLGCIQATTEWNIRYDSQERLT